MNPPLYDLYMDIQNQIDQMTLFEEEVASPSVRSEKVIELIERSTAHLNETDRSRLKDEFFALGPLGSLIANDEVTEILVNSHRQVHYELRGQLHTLNDQFLSEISYRNCIHRLLERTNSILSLERPFCDVKLDQFRMSLVDESVSHGETALSLRRHPKSKWTLTRLQEAGWCTSQERQVLERIIHLQKNFLVVGSTGAGKTSVVNALLDLTLERERSIVIEDTHEIQLPNSLSLRLLTRDETPNGLSAIDQSQLIKRALRLRPDRLVMGEIRGNEAKDFLMALSTGHRGSFGTLHANDPHQALLRLEMLIQMGAPHWKLQAIRRLMSLSLEVIIVTEKTATGHRRLEGVYQLNSLEETGFLIERLSANRWSEGFVGL